MHKNFTDIIVGIVGISVVFFLLLHQRSFDILVEFQVLLLISVRDGLLLALRLDPQDNHFREEHHRDH